MRPVRLPLAFCLLCLAAAPSFGQATAPTPPAATDPRAPRPAPQPPGTVGSRQPLPPASQAVQRGQRSFKRCNDEALQRKLRGAERRHFVTRCRLGYGQRLFRRRGAPPA